MTLEYPVDLDLPVVSYETRSVRRHDLDLVTIVGELGNRVHSAIWVVLKSGVSSDMDLRKVIHNPARGVPHRQKTELVVLRGAVFRSKRAIHSLILVVFFAHRLATNIAT
jgi:hypothetical protein